MLRVPRLIRSGGFPLAETSCAATEFRCRDGSCIGNSSRCNQFIDCEDASDEMNCSECPGCRPLFPQPPQLCPAGALEMLLWDGIWVPAPRLGIWDLCCIGEKGSGCHPSPSLQPLHHAQHPQPPRRV